MFSGSSTMASETWSAISELLQDGLWTGPPLAVAVVGVIIVIVLAATLAAVTSDTRPRPPGPWGLPIVGHLLHLSRKAPYASLTDLVRRYGPIYSLRLGSIPTVVVADSNLVRLAFRKDVFCGRPPLFVTNGILEGYGLISAEGERWKEQRRFVAKRLHDFGAAKSTTMSTTVQLEVRIMHEVDRFLQGVCVLDGRPFDVHQAVRGMVANLATALVFGQTFDEADPDFRRQLEILDIGTEIVDVAGTLNFLPFLRFLPHYRRFLRRVWSYRTEHFAFMSAIIDGHRERLLDAGEPRNFVDAYLIEMDRRQALGIGPSHFTEKQLLHTVGDLFGATLDTLKATIEWTFLFLALNPHVQHKCQEELEAVVGRHRSVRLDDRPSCPYTMATMLEAQRLASVVPLGAPHGSTEGAYLGDHFIPKGTMIIALLWSIHRDPDVWPEPDRFRPERFLDEQGGLRVPDHFMPFSTGKRICVGEELAKMTLFLVVSSTLHRFTLRLPVDDPSEDLLTPVAGFIISPRPYRMFVKRRCWRCSSESVTGDL